MSLAVVLSVVVTFVRNINAFANVPQFSQFPEWGQLLVTAFAASAGSAFWHELLKLLNALKPK